MTPLTRRDVLAHQLAVPWPTQQANVTERAPHRPIVEIPFEFSFRDAPAKTLLNGYDIHEMLGTKMRALFQRRRGRDLV